MKQEPVLAVMAAGMGSRYGGLKQIDPVDEYGHLIIDYSIYDALRAGFRKVVFIIKREHEADFRETIGKRLAGKAEVEYVFQEIGDLPEGFQVPEGRLKPWGTGHAVLSLAGTVDGPFAVINSDDYYGSHAFQMAFDFLSKSQDDEKYRYMMVGYRLENTLTENGSVARGICETDGEGYLKDIHERTRIERRGGGAACTEDGGVTWIPLSMDSTVSMNMWGFSGSILSELSARFAAFLEENLEENPMKCEFFLPFAVDGLLKEGKATVKVLKSLDRWYGVTYKEDKPMVMAALRDLRRRGFYPERLWDEA